MPKTLTFEQPKAKRPSCCLFSEGRKKGEGTNTHKLGAFAAHSVCFALSSKAANRGAIFANKTGKLRQTNATPKPGEKIHVVSFLDLKRGVNGFIQPTTRS